MLNALRSLTQDTILIYDKEFEVDLERFTRKLTLLFTSSEYATLMKLESKQNLLIFTLESDTNKVDQRKRFATGEDLICQLADEMYRCYMKEASANAQSGDVSKAKDKENLANRIYPELHDAHHKAIVMNQKSQSVVCAKLEIIWVKKDFENDVNITLEQFDLNEIISPFKSFDNARDCHHYLYRNELTSAAFLIIDARYEEAIVNSFGRISNVKQLYRYHQSTASNTTNTFTDLKRLRYKLVYDLIAYFSDAGVEYREGNQTEQAREMFVKAKKLCDILADF